MKTHTAEIKTEADLVSVALGLIGSDNARDQALGRFMRDVTVPFARHVQNEMDRWSTTDDVDRSLDAIIGGFASIIVSTAYGAVRDEAKAPNLAVSICTELTAKVIAMVTSERARPEGQSK